MRRIDLAALQQAITRLGEVQLTKGGRLLAGYFVFKELGLEGPPGTGPRPAEDGEANAGPELTFSGSEWGEAADRLYLVREAPRSARPYFDPLTGWRDDNWPAGVLRTRYQDTAILAKKGLLVCETVDLPGDEGEPQGGGEERDAEERQRGQFYRARLLDGHARSLATDFLVLGGPHLQAVDLACWIFRYEELPDDTDEQSLRSRLRDRLHLAQDEWEALFEEPYPTEQPTQAAAAEAGEDYA
jgi:hypothetical protein